ncbi:MAG: S-layer homology domain-containing protein [Candidatus Merdivicinus sp.]|jgi:hypothetical protein
MSKSKKIICLALAAAAAISCAAPVSALDSAGMSALQSMGVIQGSNYSTTTATRGEFARMLICISGRGDSISASSSTSPFSDVPYDNEYAGYIRTVAEEGTMSGYLDGTFRPYEGIRLEEACIASLHLLGYTSGSADAQLQKAQSLGLLAGISKSKGQVLTVQDCAVLFDNLLHTTTSEGKTYAASIGMADTSGAPDYTTVVASGLQGPYLCTQNVAEVLPFGLDRVTVYLNGSKASVSDLDPYDVIYYNSNMQTVWAYRNRVAGVYTAAEPSTSSPTSVTVAGQKYTVSGSAAYSLSDLGGITTGSQVTLLLDRNGTAVFALSGSHTAASPSRQEMAGIVTGVTVSSYVDASGREIFDYTANVICADGVLRSYPVSSKDAFREGDLVRINGNVLTETDKSSLRGTFNSDGSAVAGYSLASDVQILDYVDSGSYSVVYPSSLGGITLNARNLLYYHLNSSGQIDTLILKNATGDVGSYGLVTNVTEITQLNTDTPEGQEPELIVVGYTVTYLLNGQTSTVTLDADASVSRGGVSFTFKNGQLTGTKALRRTSASQISGLYASTPDGKAEIADNAVVYVKIGSEYYQTTLATVSDTSSYTLTCYYDSSLSTGKIRVIVAEES